MPSKGGGGGGGSVQTPNLYTPSGLYQGLSSVEGLGSYAQSLFNPLASMTNWASSLATGGTAQPIPSSSNAIVTGPQINIGGSHVPADQWTSQFNPQTGEVTLTNTQTGEQFGNFFATPEMQQWFGPNQIAQWQQLYNNRGQTAGGTPSQNETLAQQLGPFLGETWKQLRTIPGMENQAQQFVTGQTQDENLFLAQGNQLFTQGQNIENLGESQIGQGQGILNTGNQMLTQATTGEGLFPSQNAFVEQGVQSEEAQLGTQLAAEGLGSSTANAILRGEAVQQGAATAGQLIQGNITAAEQEQGVGISQEQTGNQTIGIGQQQISLAQQQYNLAQNAAKLVLGGQELKFGEASALAQMSMNLQQGLWSQAMQGYGILGQMISTAGSLYGIDITGYSNILQSHVQQNEIQAQVAEANAQMANQASSSMGSGLGSIFGMLGGGGSGGGGLGGLFSGIGGLFGGGAAAGAGAGAAGAVADLAPLVAGLAF